VIICGLQKRVRVILFPCNVYFLNNIGLQSKIFLVTVNTLQEWHKVPTAWLYAHDQISGPSAYKLANSAPRFTPWRTRCYDRRCTLGRRHSQRSPSVYPSAYNCPQRTRCYTDVTAIFILPHSSSKHHN
jgi:hypothetical protein